MSARLFDRDERASSTTRGSRHGRRRAVLLGARRRLGADGDGGAAERACPRTIPTARRCSTSSGAARAGRGRNAGQHGPLAPAARQDRQLPRNLGHARCSPSPSRAASTAAGCRRPTRRSRRRAGARSSSACAPTARSRASASARRPPTTPSTTTTGPTDLGAMQGYGPTLMAGAEVITMLRNFDIRRVEQHVLLRAKKQDARRPCAEHSARLAGIARSSCVLAVRPRWLPARRAPAPVGVTVRNPLDLARPSETIVLHRRRHPAQAMPVDDLRKVHVRDDASGKEVLAQPIDLNDDGDVRRGDLPGRHRRRARRARSR